LQVGLELARPLEIAARIRSDPKPPRVLLLISTGSAVCFDYTDPETRTAPILTLKARLFTRNSTRKGAGRETGRPRNPKTTTPFARKLVPTASRSIRCRRVPWPMRWCRRSGNP